MRAQRIERGYAKQFQQECQAVFSVWIGHVLLRYSRNLQACGMQVALAGKFILANASYGGE